MDGIDGLQCLDRPKWHASGKVSQKQWRFVLAFLISNDPRRAAITAGFSKRSADVQASTLLKSPAVADAIAYARRGMYKLAGISAERLLMEISKIAYSDFRKCFANGKLLPPDQWPDDIAGAVASCKVRRSLVMGGEPGDYEEIIELKFWDKNKAHDQLGRHLELFGNAAEDLGKALADSLLEARSRVQQRQIEDKPALCIEAETSSEKVMAQPVDKASEAT